MSLPVHLLQLPYTQETVAELRARLHPEVELTAGLELPSPAVFRILVAGRPAREHLLASPHLEALVVPWAGIPDATRALLLQCPHLAVHNLHHNALPVAEQAIALLLAACKFVVPMDRALRAGDWTPRYRPSPSLLVQGRLALVLGYGAIGRHVARLCRGLGMEVVAVRRRPTGTEAGIDQLHDLLPRAGVVLVCLPLTPETEGLLASLSEVEGLNVIVVHSIYGSSGEMPKRFAKELEAKKFRLLAVVPPPFDDVYEYDIWMFETTFRDLFTGR